MKRSRRFFDVPLKDDQQLEPISIGSSSTRLGVVGGSRPKLINTTPTGTVIIKPTTSTTTSTTTQPPFPYEYVISYNFLDGETIYGWISSEDASNDYTGLTISVYSDSDTFSDSITLYSNVNGSVGNLVDLNYYIYISTDTSFTVNSNIVSELNPIIS